MSESAWSPRAGRPWTAADQRKVIDPVYVGLSLPGGESFPSTAITVPLVRALRTAARRRAVERTIWCGTGYTFEWLLEHGAPDQFALLQDLGVLVDGLFLAGHKDTALAFRDSSNQRIPALATCRAPMPAKGDW